MRLGVVYCCYGNPEYIDGCLKPWVEIKKEYDILIAAVHGQFKEYHDLGIEDNDFQVQQDLIGHHQIRNIDYLYLQNRQWLKDFIPIYQTEAEIRDKGLQWLLKQNCDYIILLDGDEKYSLQEINNLIEYIQKDPFIAVYNLEFKNLTFDNFHYTKGFAPFRVWKVDVGEHRLSKVVYDNDMNYKHKLSGVHKSDKQFGIKKIPVNLCNPLHYTWNNLEKSKLKIRYAEKRWNPPNGNGCSFKINEDGNSISFNDEYYLRIGQPFPEIYII